MPAPGVAPGMNHCAYSLSEACISVPRFSPGASGNGIGKFGWLM
jgi:hypothetical protein